jgi:pimeloyl-ACP methyl ester carboxylesterase
LTEFAGFGPADLEAYRQSPLWAPRLKAAHTIPREIRAEETYVPDPAAYAAMGAAVLIILGGESAEWAVRGADAVRSALPHSRTVILEGQGHMATVTAPELLVAEVAEFIDRPTEIHKASGPGQPASRNRGGHRQRWC